MEMCFTRPALRRMVTATAVTLLFSACAGNVVRPVEEAPPVQASAPGYAAVPHPLGLQVSDVVALFAAFDSPKRDSVEVRACAEDFRTLQKKTSARDEQRAGLLELVRKDPIRYHWCFYHQVLELESLLRQAQMIDERQQAVVDAYRFLAPLARAFYAEFHDSRYLRWAVAYYRHASELAFYRRVETTPALTQELVGVGGDESARGTSEKAKSVLEKYGISASGPVPANEPLTSIPDPNVTVESVQTGDRVPAMEPGQPAFPADPGGN